VTKHFKRIDILARNRYKFRLKNRKLIKTSRHNPSSEQEALTQR